LRAEAFAAGADRVVGEQRYDPREVLRPGPAKDNRLGAQSDSHFL
jgi:hypothetical protein